MGLNWATVAAIPRTDRRDKGRPGDGDHASDLDVKGRWPGPGGTVKRGQILSVFYQRNQWNLGLGMDVECERAELTMHLVST